MQLECLSVANFKIAVGVVSMMCIVCCSALMVGLLRGSSLWAAYYIGSMLQRILYLVLALL